MTLSTLLVSLTLFLRATAAFPSDSISFAVDMRDDQGQSCGQGYTPTPEDIQSYTTYWTGSQKYGAAWALDVCTYGNAEYKLSASDHPVYPTAVRMPCVGLTAISKMSYNTKTTCGFFELYAIQEAFQKAYEDSTGNKLTAKRRIALNVHGACQFYGSGSQDCSGPYCYVWIRYDRSFPGIPLIGTLLHELGHTLSLQHSSNSVGPNTGMGNTQFWQYGDCSCIMGCADSSGTCYNAPVARQLGYVSPLADLDDANMPLNSWVNYNLPMFSTTSVNHITLRSVGMGIPNHPIIIFLSARSSDANPNGADSKIFKTYDKVLSIHLSEKGSVSDYMKPSIIGVVKVGSTYLLGPGPRLLAEYESSSDTGTPFSSMQFKISIKLISLSNADGAVVAICRYKLTSDDSACTSLEGYVDAPSIYKKNTAGVFDASDASDASIAAVEAYNAFSYRRHFLKGGSEL